MNAPSPRAHTEEVSSERRTHILDAAARSFARAGFHRATMQDVAAEAGMSPGNLYRYFVSKDALVFGLCERDREELMQEFAELSDSGGDFMERFRALGERHFKEEMRDKAKLVIEIWAEATRNPDVAGMQTDFDCSFEAAMVDAFEAAKRAGGLPSDLNSRAVTSIIGLLGDGLFLRRAVASNFDPEREIGEVFAVICALMNGTVKFPSSDSSPASGSPS